VIRDAVSGELPLLSALALRSKGHWGYAPALLATMREELTWHPEDLARLRLRVLLAEGGTPVGFHAVEFPAGEDAELEALFVEPERIGRGFGARLLADAVVLARGAGRARLRIQSDPFAEPFYLRAGAVRVGERASASVPGRLLPLLELVL
jgi:GNAT superfamily N-acetyltransferase